MTTKIAITYVPQHNELVQSMYYGYDDGDLSVYKIDVANEKYLDDTFGEYSE